MAIKYVCNTCKVENDVVVNGTFSWDYKKQDWVPDDFGGDKPFCVADGCFSEDVDEITVEED